MNESFLAAITNRVVAVADWEGDGCAVAVEVECAVVRAVREAAEGRMTLPRGKYCTESGSTMTVSGKHGGISEVEFDWLEEGACCDCAPSAYDSDGDLVWRCECCGGGRAQLK